MCGICGKVSFSGKVVERELIARMNGVMVHRGPDGEGIYVGAGIGLGQRRLAIIDLDSRSVAPLCNEDGSVWVTFNGEIYNFRGLRSELVRQGHTFRTNSDTEVIVHLYEEYGVDCLGRMRGMFAFALWDDYRKVLFAARDRLGKKPFVYARTTSSFIFASEIKAITLNPEVSVGPNFAALDSYLKYQYVPSPSTAFAGVSKLPPAHYLKCEANGTLEVKPYWQPPMPEKTRAPRAQIEEELRCRLLEAVRLRLVSDVPLGAFLSGGIDSSTIVALMAMAGGTPVKTFTIGFGEDGFDERRLARKTASRWGTEHHELVVKPDAAEVLPLLVEHYNEPFADSSAIPTYYVSKLTREHVTVALSGDGGDESFAGYVSYPQVLRWEAADRVPRFVRAAGAAAVEAVAKRLGSSNRSARARRAATMLNSGLRERFLLQMSTLKPGEKQAAYTPEFLSLIAQCSAVEDRPSCFAYDPSDDPLDWMMRHDQSFYLPDCLMVKTDVAAMASSLEVRCPFLDQEFLEFAASIPSSMKRDSRGGKAILKSAVTGLVSSEVLDGPKHGFGVPLAAWFRGELAELLRGTLTGQRAASRNLFVPTAIRRMVDEHIEGRRDWSNRLWALLFLELWFREFID